MNNNPHFIFQPINLRAKYNLPLYADLSKHLFEKLDKEFFCDQLKVISNGDPENIYPNMSQNNLIRRYKLPKSTVRNWMKAHNDSKMHGPEPGPPPAMDVVGLKHYFSIFAEGTTDQKGKNVKIDYTLPKKQRDY